jgi:hypothetical protein
MPRSKSHLKIVGISYNLLDSNPWYLLPYELPLDQMNHGIQIAMD